MSKRKGPEDLFDSRHFDREIIVLCVRWYLRYRLSLRDLVEMMAGRGLSLAHAPKEVPLGDTTIMRWVKRFTPEFVQALVSVCHPGLDQSLIAFRLKRNYQY